MPIPLVRESSERARSVLSRSQSLLSFISLKGVVFVVIRARGSIDFLL